MSDVTTPSPFTDEETTLISSAKKDLEQYLSGGKALEIRRYELGSVVPKNLIPENMNKLVVAGGCISSFILKEMVNDIDVFILNMDVDLFNNLVSCKTGPWVVKWFADPQEDSRNEDYKNEHIFATASNTLSKIQYILTDYTSRKELTDHFDFLHATASYHNGKLYINRETFDSIIKKQLVRQHKKIAPKEWRVRKYLDRNWKSEAESMLENSKSLKDILLDQMDQYNKDSWKQASQTSGWHKALQDIVQKNMGDAMKQGKQSYSIHGDDISLDDLMEDIVNNIDDHYLQTK